MDEGQLVQAQPLTRLQAMAVETTLILTARAAGYELENKKLSIAKDNPIFSAVVDAVSQIVDGIVKPW